MKRDQIKISNPCTEDFEQMEGEGFRRFCDKCDKHVHNLSDLTPEEAKSLLAQNRERGLCVVYRYDASGAVKFAKPTYPRAPRSQLTGIKKLLAAAAFVPMLAALPACDAPVQEPEITVEACSSDNSNVYSPIDVIMEAEERMVEKLRELFDFEPDIAIVAGEPMIEEWPEEIEEIPTPVVIPEPEPTIDLLIMGDIGEEPMPTRMGKYAPNDH